MLLTLKNTNKAYKSKFIKVFITIFTAFLLTFIASSVTYAEETESYQLFQTVETVTLEEGITILENTYVYGVEQEESIKVQFSNVYTFIAKDSLKRVDNITESPEFVQFNDPTQYESKHLTDEYVGYSNSGVKSLLINADLEYPTYNIDEDKTIVIFGNIKYIMETPFNNLTKESDNQKISVDNDPTEKNQNIDKDLSSNNHFKSDFKTNRLDVSNNVKTTDSESYLLINSNNSNSEIDPWKDTLSDYFEVITDELVVYDNRNGPLKPIGKLLKGQTYPIVSDYGNWHRIQFGDIFGYVIKSDTIPASAANINNENKNYKNQSFYFNTFQDVTIYDNSSGTLVPFGLIDKGQSYPIASDYGNWWRIIFSDRIGYVKKSEVALSFTNSDKYFKTLTNLPIYDNRTGKLVKVGELPRGQVYPRESDYGNWHRIKFGDIYGYVRKADTIPANGTEIRNANSNYKNLSRTFTPLNNVIVYDNTSGNLVPFGTIDKGISYPITSDYGNWWRIVLSDRVGYVRKTDVEVNFITSDKYFKAKSDLPVYDNRTGKLVKVGNLEKGQIYPRVSDYGNWHRIQFGNIYGYVRKADTSIASESGIQNLNSNFTPQSRTFKTIETVTVYDNSSGSLKSFGTIDKDVSTFSITSDYGNWWRIIYADRVGYISKSQVQVSFKENDRYFRAIKDIPVYDNRTGSLIKIGEVLKGQSSQIVSDYGNWWRVQFSDHFGYVRKSDTGYATKGEIKNFNTTYRNTRSFFTPKHSVTVYDNSSGSLVAYGTLDKDIKYHIASDYGNWWRIIFLDRIGYVRKNEVVATELPSVRIFIDPGHGGSDPGAKNNNTGDLEKIFNLDIAKRIESYLKQYEGVEIMLSRTTDTTVSLPQRTQMANNWGADYFLSVHINAGGGTGFESYIYTNPTQDEIIKQDIIHSHIANNISEIDRGKKRANYHVIRESKMSAILMEYLFIDHSSDITKLRSASYRDKLARLTAEGIAKAFNLPKK